MPLQNGSDWWPTEQQLARWAEWYPNLDLKASLVNMASYADANPTWRPQNESHALSLARNWLKRDQERGEQLQPEGADDGLDLDAIDG